MVKRKRSKQLITNNIIGMSMLVNDTTMCVLICFFTELSSNADLHVDVAEVSMCWTIDCTYKPELCLVMLHQQLIP